MIPKLFHYIWVGDRPLPDKARRFIEDAKRLHPDFEFRLWTEKELSLDSAFVQTAYRDKAWAFVSDYCRFKILHEQGGIYLDTDMELLKSFAPLLDNKGFAGLNRQQDAIYCGVIGAIPGHKLMQAVVAAYDALGRERPTSPQMLTQVFKAVQPADFTIYPHPYFYPVEEGKKLSPQLLAQAYAIHHWDESWRRFVPLRRFLRRIGVIPLYHWTKRKKANIVISAKAK
ncbi:MAG: hypothetical protein KGJ06_00715 [Pseudomonadota bacterium]|nr:hypothetical protein [Pseudomonadota bacterium]